MSYTVFYWIHTVSYIVWLLAFLGSMFYAYKTGKAYQTELEGKFMRLERKVTSIGAHIGALGILISGGAMASIPSGGTSWGWFSFALYPWLALKQAIFFIILILVGFSIKRSIAFKKDLKAGKGSTISDETRTKWKAVYTLSLWIYILVVVNTLLGWFRPLLA